MNLIVPPKRKLIELVIMLFLTIGFYFIHSDTDALILFIFGFIWNWSASHDFADVPDKGRNRMSMLKLVINLQGLVLRPFAKAPQIVKRILKVIPAGIFWYLVVFLNNSDMPWWATFIGSIAFELLQIEMDFANRRKEVS